MMKRQCPSRPPASVRSAGGAKPGTRNGLYLPPGDTPQHDTHNTILTTRLHLDNQPRIHSAFAQAMSLAVTRAMVTWLLAVHVMKPILIIYATREGHTRHIAEHAGALLGARQTAFELVDAAHLPEGFSL